jgi:hypothetical protein
MIGRSLLVTLVFVLSPIAVMADACADLVKMYTNMVAATSYRLVESSPGAPTRTTEFMAPDRIHTFGSGSETIAIGTKHFSKLTGKWFETDGEDPPSPMWAMKAYITDDRFLNHCITSNPVDLGINDGFRQIQLHDARYGVDTVYYLRPDVLPARIEITTRGKTFVKAYTEWNTPIAIEAPQ